VEAITCTAAGHQNVLAQDSLLQVAELRGDSVGPRVTGGLARLTGLEADGGNRSGYQRPLTAMLIPNGKEMCEVGHIRR
jgi:hypothetical protein